MPAPFKNRRGFTLIELLVVGGIVAIAAALAPSAIQKAREAARRSACKDNLKMIGIAIHNYHDIYATFPPGWIAHRNTPGNGPRFGWQASILPQMDQARLWDRIDSEKPLPPANTADDTGKKIFQTHLQAYRCPSDSTSVVNPMRGNYATSNYSANLGDISLPRWTTGRRTVFWPGQVDTPRRANGVMYCNSSVKFRDMLDGPSNIFLVGERSVIQCRRNLAGRGVERI